MRILLGKPAAFGVCLALLLAAGANPAMAAPRWSVQPVPAPAVPHGQLFGVSCPSATDCLAVGSYTNRKIIEVTLAERWNGTRWSIVHTPNPAGAARARLSGVSCVSSTYCLAVGNYYAARNGRQVTLVERWDGSRWSVLPGANPGRPKSSGLDAVSCNGPRGCIAVGGSGNDDATSEGSAQTLAERWDGTRWSIVPTPTPANPRLTTPRLLSGVSCRSRTDCTAVGSTVRRGADHVPLAEHWDGKAWTIQPTPVPSRAFFSQMNAVSCASGATCIAVGEYRTQKHDTSLTERWNGIRWVIKSSPDLPQPNLSFLTGVSCASENACTAVGTVDNQGRFATLAERWNGSRWSVMPTPNPPASTGSKLAGVSCAARNACTAVGTGTGAGALDNETADTATLAEWWSGAGWSLQSTPNPRGVPQDTYLRGVSCPSGTECVAVGSYTTSAGTDATLAEWWDGNRWSIQHTSGPGAFGTSLSGVSCPAADMCLAVGTHANGPLVERWNGTRWTILPAPDDPDATLNAVSCTSGTSCTVVGHTSAGGTQLTLAEYWDGTSWTVQPTPNPAGASDPELTSVSCTSATACTAVGDYSDSDSYGITLAERWNGTKWAIQTTPNRGDYTGDALAGVSCASSTSCTAVGYYNTAYDRYGNSEPKTLAEHWNGTTWRVQPTESIAGEALADVSCPSATTCIAVGGGRAGAVTGVWDSTRWTLSAPNSYPEFPELLSVSCTSSAACTAVGDTFINGSRVPRAERYS